MATFLVAHGAWSAGWAWKKMRPLLHARGHELFTPTHTGLGERAHLASPAVDLETHIAGSGPYTLVSAEHGNGVTWKRNDNWKWGPPGTSVKNLPETLIYKTITDDTTAANLLLTGGLTVAVVFGPDVQRLNASKLTHVSASPRFASKSRR